MRSVLSFLGFSSFTDTETILCACLSCIDQYSAISHWLYQHDTSPLTGQPLKTKQLILNIALRGMIREWLGIDHPVQGAS